MASKDDTRRLRYWAAALLAVCVYCRVTPAAVGENPPACVGIVLTPHARYGEAAHVIKAILEEKGRPCVLVELPSEGGKGGEDGAESRGQADVLSPAAEAALLKLADSKPAVIITCGAVATAAVVEKVPRVPVVFCMISNALDIPVLAEGSPHRLRVTGVPTDIAPAEQVSWIAKMDPKARSLAILCSDRSRRTAEAIAASAKARDVVVEAITARKDDFGPAVEALSSKGCDGVIMVPDAAVYSSVSVQRLLLWGLRGKKRVWAFSPNVVKAGALAGQYPDNADMAVQTADLAIRVIAKADLAAGKPEYPRRVQTAINERTAAMIGLSLHQDVLAAVTSRFGKEP
jgi:ABC-type uncharacterized transport system substrate-binding protein